MYSETFDRRKKGFRVKINEKTVDGSSRRIKNSNDAAVNGGESSSVSERQIDEIINRDESRDNKYSETHINGAKSLSSSGSRRSSSSLLSESSLDDFFGIDALKFTASGASEIARKSEKNYVSSSESSAKSEADNRSSHPLPTPCQKGLSPTISPPIQVMDRSGRFDSTRIPSSIFERNNNNPLEWSIASNDSLFSIHIGYNSFSREHTFKYVEPRISEELTKSGEVNLFDRMPSVTIEEIDTARESVGIENLQTSKIPEEESFKFKSNLGEDHNVIKTFHQDTNSSVSPKSSVTSLTNESGTIPHSFVPLKKRSRQLCDCCNCSWTCCHHTRPTCCHPKWPTCCRTWPTCCHTWPSCKCSCGWLFCSSCCNSDHASPNLIETEGNSFVKTNTPRKQSYKEESETTSISSSTSCWHCFQSKQTCDCCSNLSCNWFHCFSCPSCTCKLSCLRCKCCC